MRTATPGTRTGSCSFFQICMWYIYMTFVTLRLEIRTPIEKLAYKHVSYVYLKKMNYSLSWSLGLPFSLFSWTLDMAFVNLVATKFGFPLKNWHMNMYHIHIWKNEQLPVLVPGVAVLVVPLDPQYGLCQTCNLKIRIPIKKLAYKHVSYAYLKKLTTPCPSPWGCRSHCSPGPSIWPLSTF